MKRRKQLDQYGLTSKLSKQIAQLSVFIGMPIET